MGHLPLQGKAFEALLHLKFYYTMNVEGELAMPRSGRRSFRPTANSPGPAPQGLKMSDDSMLCNPGVGEFFRILPLLSAT